MLTQIINSINVFAIIIAVSPAVFGRSHSKEAIQFITDNWDNLSDADKAYFKSKIERDNKDWINR